jgi:hypothetical protein
VIWRDEKLMGRSDHLKNVTPKVDEGFWKVGGKSDLALLTPSWLTHCLVTMVFITTVNQMFFILPQYGPVSFELPILKMPQVPFSTSSLRRERP